MYPGPGDPSAQPALPSTPDPASDSDAHTEPASDDGKVHACGECGRAFKSFGHLNRHAKSHLPEALRPHACEYGCGRRFARTDNLRMHHATHDRSGRGRRRRQRRD
ncbi:hypothetical protein DFJ74DRAFT_664006 [Hyaloraphidium curvatum]|nr:hypothetical protein DFJ74DRAFT_664006 [Hyaloraphidium curvatum]